MSPQSKGIFLGVLAVIAFSLTLPTNRHAVAEIEPLFIGFGRVAIAGVVAAALLLVYKAKFPNREQLKMVFWIMPGVAFLFPVFSAWSMKYMTASNGSIIMGIMPMCTAIFAVWLARERPSPLFWVAAIAGVVLVMLYSMPEQGVGMSAGDVMLIIGTVVGALGYAYGGLLAKTMPSWQVICWVVVLALPVTLPAALYTMPSDISAISTGAWGSFFYLALISQLFGFFLWYHAMYLGGIARVGQIQLLQPFFTLLFAWAWLGEQLSLETWVFAVLIMMTVFFAQKARMTTTMPSAVLTRG